MPSWSRCMLVIGFETLRRLTMQQRPHAARESEFGENGRCNTFSQVSVRVISNKTALKPFKVPSSWWRLAAELESYPHPKP